MAWSAVNNFLDLFRTQNEEGIPISDEAKDVGNPNDLECTTNENMPLAKHVKGGDLAELAGEVDSDIASQSDSTDELDDSDESVTIAVDVIAKAGNSVSGSQPIYVERISSVFTIRSNPCSPLQRRKLFTRTKSEDTGASFSSSTSSDLNLSKSEPLSSSVDQILEANFPFRRDRLLDLLKSVKKNEEVEDQKVEKEYNEGKRIEYKVERFVSRSKANISAQLLSDDSDVTTVLSDESYETCECDLEPSSSEAESVGGDSEPTEEQEELQDVRLDRFLENLSDTSEQNQLEEEFYENNSLIDFLNETKDGVDGTSADEKRNDTSVSPMMIILDGNQKNCKEDSKDNDAQNVLLEEHPIIQSGNCEANVIELKILLRDAVKRTETERMVSKQATLMQEDVKKEQLDAEDNIVSKQHRLKVKPASSEINNVDKALKFEKQGELMDHNTKSQSEHQRKGEDSSYEELNLEKPNSFFQEHCRDMQGNSQTFEEDRTKLDGGNHQQPDYQKIMMRQHIAEKERKEKDLFVVEESKLDPKDSQKHDLFINEENYNIFNDDNNFTETDNQVSNLMIPNMESEQLVPDEMEKLCHISVEPNIANEPTLHDKSFTGNDVKNKIMTSQHEYCNPDNLERDNLDQGKVFLLKGNNEPCQLKEDEIKVSEYDIQEMEENKVVPLDQNQTSEHNEEIRKVSVWGKQKDLIEHGNEIHEMNGREQCSNKINKTELEHEFVIISEPCNDREGSASKILDPIGSGQRKLGIIESEQKIMEVQKQKEKLIQHDCVATLVDLSADFTHNQPDQNKYGQEKLEMIEKSPEMQVFDPIKSSTVKNSEKYDFDANSAFIDRSGKTVTTAQSEMYEGTKFEINIQNIESENVETSAIVLEKIVEETNKDYEECTVELQVSAECDDQLANCRKLDTLCDMEMKSTNQENKCLIGEPSDAEKQDSTKLFEVTDDLGAELCDKPSSSKKDIQNLNESQNDKARDICVEIRESDFPVKQAPPKIVKLIPIKVKDFENIVTVSGQTKMDLKAVHPDHGEERLGSTRIQERGLEFVSNTELHISEREDQGLDISSLKTIEASKDIKKINYKDGKASTKIAKRNSEQAAHLKWSQTDLKSQDETLTSAERGKTAVESEKVVKDYGLKTNDTDVKQINSLSYSSARKTGYDYSHAHPSNQATSESGDKNLIGLPLKISAKLSNDGIIQDDVRAMKASDEITIDAVSSLKDSGGIKHDDLTSLTASDEITTDAVRSLKDSGGIKHDDLTSPKVSDVKKPDRMAGVESSHNGKRSATVEGLQFYETRVKPDKDNAFYSPARRIKEGGTTDLNISDNAIQEDYMGATGLKSATDRIKKDEVLCLKASADENHHNSATVPDSSTGKDIRPDEVIGRSVVPDSSVGKVIKHDAVIGRSVIPDSSVGKVIKHDAVIGRSVVPESPASKDIKHDDIIGRSVVPDSSAGKDIKHDDVIGRSAAADGIKKDGVAGLKASPDATLMETLSHAVDAAAFDVSEAPQQRPHDDGGSDSFQHCQSPKRAKKNFAAVSAVSSFDLSHYRKYVRESSRKALDTSKDVAVISSYALEKRESGFDLEDKENIECIHTDLQTSIAENLSEFCEEHSEDGTKNHENSSKFCVKTTRQRSSINVKIALFNKERERIIADSSRREGHCHNKSCNKTNQNIEDLIASDKYEITDNTSCSDDSKLALMITDKVCSDSDDRTTQTDQNKHTKKVYTKDKSSTTAKRIIKKVQRSVTRVLSPNNEKKPEEQFVFPTNCVTRVLSPQKEKRPEEQSVDPAMLIPSSESVQSMMPGRVSSTIASTPPSTSPPELMKERKVSGQEESKGHSDEKLPTTDEPDALAPQAASHSPPPVRQSVQVFRSLQNTWQDLSTSASSHRNSSTEEMAAVDTVPLPSSKMVVWPRKIDHSDVIKAIPPWAEPGAQPPPPPLTHYSTFSPPFARRQIRADDSGPHDDPFPSKQSKMSKSKSESQLNNYGTLFSLKNIPSPTVPFKSPQKSGLNKSERSLFKRGQREPSQTTESVVSQTGGSRAADNANDITAAYVIAAAGANNNNVALKADLQITGGEGVTGAPGQAAKTPRVGDITSVEAQSTTPPATDQAQPRQQRSTDMVTVRTGSEGKMGPGGALPVVGGEQVAPTPGSGGKTVPVGKFGPKVSKGAPSAGVKVSGVSVGVAGGGGTVVAQDVPWRKGEASAKAAHMPASPRLDTRKNVSLSQSSQPVVAPPPVIKEQGEELPDAPWRKSPQQPRKTTAPAQQKPTSAAPSATVTVATTAAPAAAPATAVAQSSESASTAPSTVFHTTPAALISSKTTTAEQSVEEKITKTIRETSVKSSVSVKQESSSFSSSLVSDSGQKGAFVATSTVSSSSSMMPSATILNQTGTNPANLPPHVPPQHKKISGSPRGSPKGSPILPRRGAQSTPPPAPSASTKPAVPPVAPSGTEGPPPPATVAPAVPSVPAANNVPAVASSSSVSSTFVSVAESTTTGVTSSLSSAAFSATSVLSEQSVPIVLRNTVVPLPDETTKEKVKIVKNENEVKPKEPLPPPSLAPDPASAPKAVPSNEPATNIDTKPTTESSNESKAAIKSVFTAESAQFESLSSSQVETSFSLPPPPPSLHDPPPSEQDSVLPPLPPPPPATFLTEDPKAVSSVPFNILPLEREKEEYVPLPVTSRIRSFEKQSSMDDYREEKPVLQQIRPVGPWVKKTSAGPVAPQELWELSPEGETWPRPPPPPPPQQYSEAPSSPPSSHRPPHPHSPYQIPQKPHTYQPQVYQSPAQLERMQKQQLRTAPAPPPHHQYQQQQHQQQQQQLQQQQRAPQQPVAPFEQQSVPPRTPRTRTGSTSEQLNLSYSLAQNGQGTGSAMGGDGPGPSAALTQIPTTQPGGKDPYFDPWCDPENPRVIQFQDVSAAAFKIKSGIMNTPCTRSHMSALTGVEIFFKKEFNQYTGSFKERGARYTLLSLTEEQRQGGVIAASAGNHALALSYHGQDLGIPVTVVMPLVAPIMKVQACRQYGANILVRGADIAECRMIALKMAKEQNLLYINGYDHPHILAGQGTMGLEIVEQVPNIDAVVIPVGGGGLIAGVALAVKALYPHIQVIGVESEKCASFTAALANGRPTYTKAESTLADGLAVPTVGVNAFATASSLVDKVVTVREEWIAIAILRLVELEKAVVEGAGATALAAILAGELPELKGKRVVIPLCGGNIDTTVLGRCLERGLAADGRLVKFTVTVSDRPGGIAELTRLMASLGVSIKDMTHERAWIRSDIFSVEVKVLCETRDFEHFHELKVALEQRYKIIRFAMPDQIHAETDF